MIDEKHTKLRSGMLKSLFYFDQAINTDGPHT